jgi:hypothetical protein
MKLEVLFDMESFTTIFEVALVWKLSSVDSFVNI